jgi:hypothetical protein
VGVQVPPAAPTEDQVPWIGWLISAWHVNLEPSPFEVICVAGGFIEHRLPRRPEAGGYFIDDPSVGLRRLMTMVIPYYTPFLAQ